MRPPRMGGRRWAVLLCAVLAPALARSACETKPGDYHLIALPPDRTTPNEWMPPGAGACGHFTARVSPGGQVSLFARYALPAPWASWCNHLEYRGDMGLGGSGGSSSSSSLMAMDDGVNGSGSGGGGGATGAAPRSALQEERLGRRRRRRSSSRRRRRRLLGGGSNNETTAAPIAAKTQPDPAVVAALIDAAQEGGGPFPTSVPLTLYDAGVELPPSALITLVGLPSGAGASGKGDGANATAAAAAAAGVAKAPRAVLADGTPAIVRLRVCTEGGCDSVDFALVTPNACLLGTKAPAAPCARAGATDAGTLVATTPTASGVPPRNAPGAKLATCLPCYLGSQRLEGLALLPGPPASKTAAAAAGELRGPYAACAACPPGTAAPPPPEAAAGDAATATTSASAAASPPPPNQPTPAPGICLPCPGGTVSGVYGAKRCLSECPAGTFAPAGSSSCQPCAGSSYQRGGAAASCSACPADSWSSGVFYEAGQGCLRCSNGRKCATVAVRDPPVLGGGGDEGGGNGSGNNATTTTTPSSPNATPTNSSDPIADPAELAAAVASVSEDPNAELEALRRQNTDAAPQCAAPGAPGHFASSRHAPRFVLVDAQPANDACLRVSAAAAQLARVTIVLDRTCEAPVWYGAEPDSDKKQKKGGDASSSSSSSIPPDAEPALLAGFVSRGGGLRPPGARAPYAARTVSTPPIRYNSGAAATASAASTPPSALFSESHQVVLERGDHGGLFSRQLAGDDASAAFGRMWRATQPSRLSLYGAGYLPEADAKTGTVVFGAPADLGLVGEPSCTYTLRLADDVFYEMKPVPCPPGKRGCAPAGRNAPCGPGKYRVPLPENTAACALCPPGTASSDGAGESCAPCPAGTFAQGVGSARCEPCDRGTVATLPGAAVCLPCGFELSTPTAMPPGGREAAKGVAFYADPKAAKAGADAAAAQSDVIAGAAGRYTYWLAADRACEPCPAGAVSGLPSPTGSAKCFSIDPRTRAPCCATCAPGSSPDACPGEVAKGGEAVAAAAATNRTALAEQQRQGSSNGDGGGSGSGNGSGNGNGNGGNSDFAAALLGAPSNGPIDPFVGTQVSGAVLAVVGKPRDVELRPGAQKEELGGDGCSGEPFGEALRCLEQLGAFFGYRLGPPLECRYQRLPLPDMVLALELGPAADALARAAAQARASMATAGGGAVGARGGGGANNATAAAGNKNAPAPTNTTSLLNPFAAPAEEEAMLEVRRCRSLLGSALFPGQGFLLDSRAAWLDAPAPEVSPWPQAFRMRPGAPGVDPLDLSARGHRALLQPKPGSKDELELTLWDYTRYGAGRQAAYDAPPYTPPLPSEAASPLRGCRVALRVASGSALGVVSSSTAAAAKGKGACPPGTEPSGPACLMCASDTASDGKGPCVSCEPPRVAPFPGMGACVVAETTPTLVQADLLMPTPPGSTALGGNPATCEGEFGFGS